MGTVLLGAAEAGVGMLLGATDETAKTGWAFCLRGDLRVGRGSSG